jgi:hypothetical protein
MSPLYLGKLTFSLSEFDPKAIERLCGREGGVVLRVNLKPLGYWLQLVGLKTAKTLLGRELFPLYL